MPTFVSYLRVSTTRQGSSGLGIEAQRATVSIFVENCGGNLIAEHVEVESGSKKARPVLVRSIAQCRREGATLLLAKLDRLGRNVAFISSLIESGVDFVAADAPYANRFMLHVLAAFAEHEREQISLRTTAALQAAKARGVRLGAHGKVLAQANRTEAIKWAETLRPVATQIFERVGPSPSALARELNVLNITSRTGGRWSAETAKRLIKRLELGA